MEKRAKNKEWQKEQLKLRRGEEEQVESKMRV